MIIMIGDKVRLTGVVVEMSSDVAQLKVEDELVLVPVNSLTFVSRPVESVNVTKEELEKVLQKWDYSQTQTVDSVWDYLCETSRL